jgi:hypothetical protein
MVHAAQEAPVQLVTQRIRTAAGKSCVAFWDTGSQVTLMTHKTAKEMGLKPIQGLPLNLMGVGNSQKTRSTVWYKIPLVDTGGGRTVEVAAYGISHIMDPLEAVDPGLMRAVFPEAPTGGIETASGGIDLLIGQDNLRLFPVEHRRVEDVALHRSRFGAGWIACGRPPGLGDPLADAGMAASAGVRTVAEAAISAGKPTHAAAKGKPASVDKKNEPSGPKSQLRTGLADRATRAVTPTGPSRVIPPLHIERGFSSLPIFCQPKRLARICRADARTA